MGNPNDSDCRLSPGLYIRQGDEIVEAPEEDVVVAKAYPEWPDKGPVIDGLRLTIMTKKKTYPIDEEVRVIHVLEATMPGRKVHIMGPKEVFGEYVDGQLQGADIAADQRDAFTSLEYDGRVLDSPATDFNYEITTYFFTNPGIHRICWQPGRWKSNTLEIEVLECVEA